MKITDFVCFEALVPQLEGTTRDEVIAELVDALDKAGKIGKGKAKAVAKAIIDRENEASTGIGKSFAYLVPAFLSDSTVIISTGTRNLQDQLFHKVQ